MRNPQSGDGYGEDWGIDEVEDNDDGIQTEGPELIRDWEALDPWLRTRIQKVVLGWFRPIALLLMMLALLGAGWERVLIVGIVLILPILETIALTLGLPLVVFSLSSKRGPTSGSREFGRRPRAPPRRM